MRTSKYVLVSAFALVLAGAMVAGISSTPTAAAVMTEDAGSATPRQIAPGTFIPSPTYSNSGFALVVFTGGSVNDLELAAGNAGASGVWVQDVTGRYQLLPVQGPAFLKSGFAGAFAPASPNAPNFPQAIAVTLVAAPVMATSPNTVTLAQNGSTLTLHVGDSFLLMLGETATWNVQVADQNVVSRVVNITVIRGAQGVYQANQPGTTTLTADGAPICVPGTLCPQFIVHFTLAIVVLPVGAATSGIQGIVTRGPICPVQSVQNPCPDQPYQATIIFYNALVACPAFTCGEVTRTVSGIDGLYSVVLSPGTYTVVAQNAVANPGGFPRPPSPVTVTVTVPGSMFVTVNLSFDTGIR